MESHASQALQAEKQLAEPFVDVVPGSHFLQEPILELVEVTAMVPALQARQTLPGHTEPLAQAGAQTD